MIRAARDSSLSAGKIVLIGLTTIFALFVLLAFLQLGFVYWVYTTVETWTTARLGFDYYLSNLLATVFTCAFSLLTPYWLGISF
jgi:hypothetical protein